jgi:hypothetical protein
MRLEHWWKYTDRGRHGQKPVSMSLWKLQIHIGLHWDCTSAAKGWWLTAAATSGPMQTLEVRSDTKARIWNTLYSVCIRVKHILCSHTIHNVIKDKFSQHPLQFMRLQINETILTDLYASVKIWELAQIIICYVFELTTVQHTRIGNCPVSYQRMSNNNTKLSPHCWSSNNSVSKVPRLWVGSSGILLLAGSRHVLFPRMSAADLASYSIGSCPEGKVDGVWSSSLNSTPVPRSRSSGAIPPFSLYVLMSCTGQFYPCHCTSQY